MFQKMNQNINGFHGGPHFIYAFFYALAYVFIYKEHIEVRVA